jgi:hypothetical protein
MPSVDGMTVRDGCVDLDPRTPSFVADPYPADAAMRELGRSFRWLQVGHRFYGRHDSPKYGGGRQRTASLQRGVDGWPIGTHAAAFARTDGALAISQSTLALTDLAFQP